MRIVLALVIGLIAGVAQAQSPTERAAIQSVITLQLEAFQHDDAPAAFAQASPMIQGMFGTPGNFITMVQNGYPPVYRPRQSAFGPLVSEDGQVIQKVELVGPDGRAYLALYTMERQADGSWKINGCTLTESESVGA
jgi:hypothetical protein